WILTSRESSPPPLPLPDLPIRANARSTPARQMLEMPVVDDPRNTSRVVPKQAVAGSSPVARSDRCHLRPFIWYDPAGGCRMRRVLLLSASLTVGCSAGGDPYAAA